MNQNDLAYASGLFDGEGCVNICGQTTNKNSYILKLEVNMTDESTIRWFYDNFGGYFRKKKKSDPRHKLQYQWTVSGKQMANFILLTLPYIRLKKERFELALKFYETISISHRYRGGISRETSILRNNIYKRIRELNKRGVDNAS